MPLLHNGLALLKPALLAGHHAGLKPRRRTWYFWVMGGKEGVLIHYKIDLIRQRERYGEKDLTWPAWPGLPCWGLNYSLVLAPEE